jgi:hypothetical protein
MGGWVAGQSQHETVGDDSVDTTRKEMVHADISKRIRRACSHLSAGEFEVLVDAMTDRQLRGERRFNEYWSD